MSRYTGPVTRISRRLGVMLFSNGQSKKKAYEKKPFKPGMHGQKHVGQFSEFNKQLREKQKARAIYGITEKQSRKYYQMATKKEGATGVVYMSLLESRLDNVIYRSGIAQTRPQARQLVCHGLVLLNNKRVNTPSILVNEHDEFEIRQRSKNIKIFDEAKASKARAPKWIEIDMKNLKGKVLKAPGKEDIEHIIENQMITEFYSK